MHEDAIQEGMLWRLARTALVGVALMFVMTLIGKELSFGSTAYAVGTLIVFFLTTLTDRTDFYDVGPRSRGSCDRSS